MYFDNFVPNYYADLIEEKLMDIYFPWYFLESASTADKPEVSEEYDSEQFGFYHSVFSNENGGILSNYYYLLLPMVSALEDKLGKSIDIKRIRIGMSTNIGRTAKRYPHVDLHSPHRTFLYYVNDSDGDTVFYKDLPSNENGVFVEESRNTPKKNTAVIFDGLKYHSSSFPTKNSRRVTININFSENS